MLCHNLFANLNLVYHKTKKFCIPSHNMLIYYKLKIEGVLFMTQSEVKRGFVICNAGDAVNNVHIILKGQAETILNGKSFILSEGEGIGFCYVKSGKFEHTYTAYSDTTIISYPVSGPDPIGKLIKDNPGARPMFVRSISRQIDELMKYRNALAAEADKACALVKEVIPLYERLCGMYAIAPRKLDRGVEIIPYKDEFPAWLQEYYNEVSTQDPKTVKEFFSRPGIAIGFIKRASIDFDASLLSCTSVQVYLKDIATMFIDRTGHDLFGIMAELHLQSINIKGADTAVEMVMAKILRYMVEMTFCDTGFFKVRLDNYKKSLDEKRLSRVMVEVSEGGEKQNLADSLDTILKYSGIPTETCSKFSHMVQDYKDTVDKVSSDDDVRLLRRDITKMFNEIYLAVFLKYVTDNHPSTIIKMFVKFGYVDAALAGFENADYLYSIADSLKGDPSRGVYTIDEWLKAVYIGKKDPCRNEFDMDYAAHINELKQTNKIDAAEATRMLADKVGRLKFEIENVFPVANKLTFGRITIFCPLFSEHNVGRSLEQSLVTPNMTEEVLDEIRSKDFSAFYRGTMYSNPDIGVPKETINVEVMPDIILLPNVGTRGIMWQEIEGRKRTTPARMLMPVFLIADFKQLIITLTGEFRWEMCKRIQGSRWQDITDASLTSEYCDYLQFYRTNRDLSADVKESVKVELTRARNNYKNVFVSNYLDWILYESSGSPRLNKYVRRMLFTYCPFSLAIREALSQNPQYGEPLKRYNIKQQQRETLLSRLIQKLSNAGTVVPNELYDELAYVKK